MQMLRAVVVLSLAITAACAENPVSKALALLNDLTSKITAQAEKAQATHGEFATWCKDRQTNLGFEIQTGTSEVAALKATIEEASALASSSSTKVDELGANIATDDADLQAAKDVRAKEASDFGTRTNELNDVIDTLKRAIGILQRDMQKGGAAFLQASNMGNLAQAFTALVQAAELSSADGARLTALVQGSQQAKEANDDAELGAPVAAVYESHSGNLVDTLEDLLDTAQSELSDAQKEESNSVHNFKMLEQSLVDGISFARRDMAEAKAGRSAAAEKQATAEGDLTSTTKELNSDTVSLAAVKSDCGRKTADYDAEQGSRQAELEALAAATKALNDMTGGAEQITYGLNQVSFLQRSQLTSGADLAGFEVVQLLRDLAKKQRAPALAQVASQAAMLLRSGSGEDVFGKVKTLISALIDRLESDAAADASHKAFCDKENAESETTKAEKSSKIETLSTKIDQMAAQSAHLKEEVAALQASLAHLAKAQAEMNEIRQNENTNFVANKVDMDAGIQGVQLAMRVLRDYYASTDKAHDAASGSSTSLLGMLEVVESDFSKDLAAFQVDEDGAQAAYEEQTKANEIEKVTKEQDVKYKNRESASLDKAASEATADRANVQAELDAVTDYLGKLEQQCVPKAETYSDRKARREAEVAGLRRALEILENQAGGSAFLQSRRALRGLVRPHRQ